MIVINISWFKCLMDCFALHLDYILCLANTENVLNAQNIDALIELSKNNEDLIYFTNILLCLLLLF